MQHPDYPITFKPAIARYDFDQTYDVLEFVHLPQGFDGLMQQLGIPAFELMAIDRFTPYRYLWAEQYSDYVYNFLKQFNYAPHNSIAQRTLTKVDSNIIFDLSSHPTYKGQWQDGVTYARGDIVYMSNFSSIIWYLYLGDGTRKRLGLYRPSNPNDTVFMAYTINNVYYINDYFTGERRQVSVTVPSFTHSNRYDVTAEYPLQLTAGEYAITFLVEQGQKDGITGTITTINQVHRQFSLTEDTTIDLNQLINGIVADDYALYAYHAVTGEEVPQQHPQAIIEYNIASRFCANSLVLSKQVNGTWQPQTVSSPNKFLFYADIATYFTEVSNALMQYFTQVHNDYKEILGVYSSEYPLQHYFDYYFTPTEYIDYKPIPQFMVDFCYLQRANNNRWGGNLYLDLGFVPSTRYISNFAFSNAYANLNNLTFTDTIRSLRGGFHPKYPVANGDYTYGYYLIDLPSVDEAWITALLSGIVDRTQNWATYGNISVLAHLATTNLLIGQAPYVADTASFYLNYDILPEYAKGKRIGVSEEWSIGFNDTYEADGLTYRYQTYSSISFNGEVYYSYRDQATATITTTQTLSGYRLLNRFAGDPLNGIVEDTLVSHPRIDSPQYLKHELWTQQEWQELYNYNAVSDADYLTYLLQTKAQLEEYMVDSVRLKEIHACLGAGEASYYTDANGNPQEVVMHLARKVDLLCKFCGLNFALDGSYNDHQSTRYYPPGDTIPGGWYFDQVGINAGWEDSSATPKAQDNIDIDQQRVGLAYEIRSNLLVDANGKKVITNSGTVLCNNFIQYIDAIFDDLDKALDWQDIGTGAININDQTFVFEGMLDLLQEILYQVAESNNNSDESKIAIGVTQQITKEILKAIGLPYGIKTFEYEIQTDWSNDPQNITGENESLPVPYPATLRGAPTLVDILIAIIGNLAVQNTGKFTLKNAKKQEILEQLKNQPTP